MTHQILENFQSVFLSIAEALIVTDAEGTIRWINPAAEKLIGWSQSAAAGKKLPDVFRLIHAKTGTVVPHPVMSALRENAAVDLAPDTVLITGDGKKIPIAGTCAPIRNEPAEVGGAVLVLRDRTGEYGDGERQKERESRFRANEALIRSIGNNLPNGMLYQVIRYPDGSRRFAYVSDAVKRFYGCSPREAMADASLIYGRVAEEDRARVWKEEENAFKRFSAFSTEVRMINPSGDIRWSYFASSPRRLEDGSTCWDGFEIDITDRKKTEETLRQVSCRQEALLSAIPDIIMEVNADKVYTWANQAGLSFFGEDVIGREAAYYFAGEQKTYSTVKPLFNGQENVIYVESLQRRKDGQKRLLAWWCRVLKDENGKVIGALSSARDITEQRTLEAQLLQAQKMESVGRLAGGVAHDFNNMLQSIIGHTDLALSDIGVDDPLRDNLLEIRKSAGRSAELTRQLLAFARKQTVNPKILDLNDTVAGMLKMLRRLIGEDIELIWKPGANLWPVKMDPTQVDQILANLSVNARDAITGVGTLTIETGNVCLNEFHSEGLTGYAPGDYIRLSVTDDGCGMDKDVLRNIFDPFFTTKEIGKGTGLGLATVYGIVKQNNGWISAVSEPGKGASFHIYLPREPYGEAAAIPGNEDKPERGDEIILLVEDDESILQLGAAILKRFGYTLLIARTPGEALNIVRKQEGPIHLLITDVVMPEMNGRDLKDRISAMRPGIKVLFMSGYTADIIAHHGVLESGIHFLQKPFSINSLASSVRKGLDNPTPVG
ncbi:MAG: PAS domain S-box protein [Thermodesulfobacteriota bacterium]